MEQVYMLNEKEGTGLLGFEIFLVKPTSFLNKI